MPKKNRTSAANAFACVKCAINMLIHAEQMHKTRHYVDSNCGQHNQICRYMHQICRSMHKICQ